MGPWSTLRNTVGLLALGVSLALASPGVNVVRAEPSKPGTQAAAAPFAECPAPAAAAVVPAKPNTDAFVKQLRRDHASPYRKLEGRSDGDWVVLNTRGYNYGPQRGAGPAPAQQEEPGR